jgi:hypothetical protein
MNPTFEFEIEDTLALSRTRWVFMMNGTKLALSTWAFEKRPSRRHKYKVETYWSALGGQGLDGRRAKVAPPVPVTVQASLLTEVRSRITLVESYAEIWRP